MTEKTKNRSVYCRTVFSILLSLFSFIREMLACFEASGADFDASARRKRRPLEVWLSAAFAGRVKLGSANTV